MMDISIKERITSRKNPAVLAAARLSDKKERDARGVFGICGVKLFDEAVRAGADIRRVFVTDGAVEKYAAELKAARCGEIFSVTDEVFSKLTDESAPQGIFAEVAFFDAPKRELFGEPFVILLDGVADPKNLGAVVRCADAFGAERVYTGEDGADVFGPKAVRACMGSLFRVGVERCDIKSKIRELCERGYLVLAATLDENSKNIGELDLSRKIGFVVGNEGHGVSDEVRAVCDGSVIIPMRGGAESLNASVAAAILMWEAERARL